MHVDADILDRAYVPNHRTKEPNGPDMAQTLAAIDAVLASGKVAAYAVVSVSFSKQGNDVDVASGVELVRGGLAAWRRHGMSLYASAQHL